MCRLFGLSAGTVPVHATFWLLDAPDSLQLQSRTNADGTGLAFFDTLGRPTVDKQAEAAYSDVEFITEAKTATSQTFVAHVRIATTGLVNPQNTHPFEMDGRVMAHNGGFERLDILEEALGDDLALIQGDTDSERYFALITQHIRANGGDVGAGITSAAQWIATNLPLFSLNIVLANPTELWALRYPDHHKLFVYERTKGAGEGRPLEAASGSVSVASAHLAHHPSVVIASEPMDDSDGWRLLDSGELIHVGEDLVVSSTMALPDPPHTFSKDPQPWSP